MAGNPLMGMMQGNNSIISAVQNSPWMKLINMFNTGGNSNALFEQFVNNNSGMAPVMQMANGKTPTEFGNLIKSEAQQKGINVNQLAAAIGMPPQVAKQFGIDIA